MTSKLAENTSQLVVRTTAKVLVMLVLLGTAALAVAQSTCNVTASPGYVSSTYGGLLVQNGPGSGYEPSGHPGWTGSDGASSVLLPNGNTAFFLSDSYIGQSPEIANDGTVVTDINGLRTRTSDLFHAHNVVAIFNPSTDKISTLVGPKNPNGFATSYLVPSNTLHKYWPNDELMLQTDSSGTQSAWSFLGEFDGSTYVGGAIAQLNYPGLGIGSIAPYTNLMLTLPSGITIRWGTSAVLTGSYGNYTIFVYGSARTSPTGAGQPYIAKVSVGSATTVSDAANMANWLFYNSTYGWVSETDIQNNANEAPTPIIGASGDPNNSGDSIVAASSIAALTTVVSGVHQTSYVVLGEYSPGTNTSCTSGGPQLVLYTACSPQGPYSAKTVVYSPPEAGMTTVPGMTGAQHLAGNLCTYFPNMHPQFDSNGNLIVSYDVNDTVSSDLVYADAYRPRFIEIPITGLQ